MDVMFWTEVGQLAIAALGGAGAVLVALLTKAGDFWTRRFQSRLDSVREEKTARLGTDLQRTALVDKVRFEHEYQVYRDVWAATVKLQEITGVLSRLVAHPEATSKVLEEASEDWDDAFEAFCAQVSGQKPFYANEIYAHLATIQGLSKEERDHCLAQEAAPKTEFSSSVLNHALHLAVQTLHQGIRSRIEAVRVV